MNNPFVNQTQNDFNKLVGVITDNEVYNWILGKDMYNKISLKSSKQLIDI